MADRVSLSGTKKTLFTKQKDAASGTTLTILGADSGKIPHVHQIVITTDTAGTYTLKIGSTEVLDLYLSANSGYDGQFDPLYLTTSTANQAITLTKPSGANTSASMWYTLELSKA